MKRKLAALLAFCALLAGCAKKAADAPPPAPAAPAAVPGAVPAPAVEEPPAEESDALYDFGDIRITVPAEYRDALLVETDLEPWNDHWTPLISLTEKASVEAFEAEHPDGGAEEWGAGWLCTVSRLDRVGFEDWASGGEQSGTYLFARSGEARYYIISRPTDARLYRAGMEGGGQSPTGLEGWVELNDWAEALPGEIIADNALIAYDASELLDADYTYGGEHVELGCRFPGRPMDLVLLALSQPERQGEGGVWCVERVRYVYSDYDWTDTHLVFPVALGIDAAAADYYARLQAECDAGEYPGLLTPRGAALDYARRNAWLFGEDVSATDFEFIEALG